MRPFARRIPPETRIFLLEHLRVMLRAGIPISRALTSIREHLRPRALADAVGAIATAVESGRPLAEALGATAWIMPPVAIELIRAGEASGTLEESLVEVARILRKEDELRSRVRNALLYPAIVVGAMLVMVVGIVTFVLPRLLTLFEDVTAPLPLPTRFLIAATAITRAYGVYIGATLLLIIMGCVAGARTTAGRVFLHRFVLRLGRLGTIAKEVNLARLARTLAGLLATDIPIVHALDLTAATVTNWTYRDALTAAARTAERGGTVSATLTAHPRLFPSTAIQLITVGEETGQLDRLLGELADFYETNVDRALRNLTTIIEPILILCIGAGIAFIAVAVLQPMYTVAQAI